MVSCAIGWPEAALRWVNTRLTARLQQEGDDLMAPMNHDLRVPLAGPREAHAPLGRGWYPRVKSLNLAIHLILAGLGGGLLLWLGLWLYNPVGPGETPPAPALAEERVTVTPPLAGADRLSPLVGDWLKLEPWSGRSINFHAGVQSLNQRLTPVPMVALWVALSSLLWVLASRGLSARQTMGGLAILFLTGWLALDLRWQRQLASRLVETYERYGHLPVTERPGARPDARIALAVDRARQALPAQPTRLFILSKDPNGYVTHRTRYHFLPHRAYATDRLPSPGRIHEGDHILVMTQPEMARYDQKQGILMSNKVAVAVEFLGQVPGFGTLYRVTGGK